MASDISRAVMAKRSTSNVEGAQDHVSAQPRHSPCMHSGVAQPNAPPLPPYWALSSTSAGGPATRSGNVLEPVPLQPLRRSARINNNLHRVSPMPMPSGSAQSHTTSYPHTPPPHPSSFPIRRTITKASLRSGSPLSLSPASSVSPGPSLSSVSTPIRRKRRARRSTSWTAGEDELLTRLVTSEAKAPPTITASKIWSKVAAQLPGRTGKQCRERWLNQLQPGIRREPWNEREERILREAHARLGNHWVAIAKLLEGRTDNCVKNHWNSMLRKRQRREKAALRAREKASSFVVVGGGGGGGGASGGQTSGVLTAVPTTTSGRGGCGRTYMVGDGLCGLSAGTVGALGSPASVRTMGSPDGMSPLAREDVLRRDLTPALVALATAASSVPPSPLTDSRQSRSLSPTPGKVKKRNMKGRNIM